MAYTAHTNPERMVEHHDPPEILQKKAQDLAKMIQEARFIIVFTGAGISTSSGIPDFRGTEGVWTLAAQGRVRSSPSVSLLRAMPTPTHLALLELLNKGKIKYIVSQNIDGLHRKSGIPAPKLAELHGNINLERCSTCSKEYLRDYDVTVHHSEEHKTGRKCYLPSCQGELVDSIINFGENLPQIPLSTSFHLSNNLADLCIVLGSSCTVAPANEIPKNVLNRGGKLAIVNLQITHLDPDAHLVLHSNTDDCMKLVMQELDLQIPKFQLRREFRVENSEGMLSFTGLEPDGSLSSIFRGIEISLPGADKPVVLVDEKERPDMPTFAVALSSLNATAGTLLEVQLHFMGHYNEPILPMKLVVPEKEARFKISFDPLEGTWQTL